MKFNQFKLQHDKANLNYFLIALMKNQKPQFVNQ